MKQMKWKKMLISCIMVLAMVFQLTSPILTAAISDLDTSDRYTESLGDEMSTEYAGRVWTDKSVFENDVRFDTYGGGSVTVPLEREEGEDFLISYSALATTQSVSGQSQAPVDVVLVIDISGSMSNGSSNMDNGKSRIYNTAQAANASIEALMEMNPNNRVALVVFSSNATTVLPLGRYTKLGSADYLTLNRDKGSSQYAQLTVKAVSGSGNVNRTVNVEGGTNLQVGFYEGMNILASEAETVTNVNGTMLQRVPAVILLSDGSPTYSSDSRSWWAPADNYNDGPGSEAYPGNGFKAILAASYMKDAIDRNYKVAGTSYATKVYTIGMGITGLQGNEKDLAEMTLNPGAYWNSSSNNTMKSTIKNYWSSYTANHNTGTLNINVGEQVRYGMNWTTQDKNYALTHPTTGYDVDPANGYDYVDGYYSADNASAVNSVFGQIVSDIGITAPQVPTELKGDNPLTDGYITYTDPIGKYMEVKDVKSIIYAGTEFTQKSRSTSGDTTAYTFSGEVHSPVYGDQEIANILITVTKDSEGDETLTVKIPASVIPLRVNTVKLNADGSVKSHTNNGAFPTRVIYSVGLQADIRKVSDDGHEYVDGTKLSQSYIQANVNADGSINFYSNVFSNTNVVHGKTAGDATVEFEPSHTNPFYYILSDMAIYKDRELAQQVPSTEELADDTVYYFEETYYHGTDVETVALARTGAQLKQTAIKTGLDGYLYRETGSPRLNRILEFEGTKVENATGTAEDFYAPSFVYADGSSDPFDGKFVIYHGNNGVISRMAGGNLEIRKEVAAAAGLTAPGESFTFTLELDSEKINGSSFTYVIRDAQLNQVSTGTVSATQNTITLEDGQVATVYSLPPEATYTVTEATTPGFATESQGETGMIHAGQTQQVLFTNTYSVQPVTSGTLTGKKVFEGRSWENGDSFTFFLTPFNNCPLPDGYDAADGITVSAPDAAGGKEATFEFGAIEFTAPGLYRYTVYEKEPDNDGYLPGVTYSRALYRIAFLVEDTGSGTLEITSTDIQKLYDDEANPLFTYGSDNEIVMNNGQEAIDDIVFVNTYKADSVIRVPVALKDYSDPSGTKPLVSGMFEFRLQAVGYYVDQGELQTDITDIPMPAGSVNGAITTTNEGHNITFPHVEFSQDVIPAGAESITFRYELSEVIPGTKVPGMTYDETVFSVDVTVEIDPGSHELKVSAIYPDGEWIATFQNSYKLESVKTKINGTKILNGRDMLEGETFTFTLVGANAATNNAIRDGVVIVPRDEATVSGGKNGKAEKFAFSNIEFTKPGTYTFLVSETRGSAPAVFYDDSLISVTFEVADKNGDAKLEIASTTYSGGGSSADFVNTYTYTFTGESVSLEGTKNLTGKTLLDGEFFFRVVETYNGKQVSEKLVGTTGDDSATDDTYSGTIRLLDGVTYSEAGTYVYTISEQIPTEEHQVKGTRYDESVYRYTVVVADDGEGHISVESKKLQVRNGSSWKDAERVVFNNAYEPKAAVAAMPLIKKVVAGDRNKALEENEFQFEMKLTSGNEAGVHLPAEATVGNAANGDIQFGEITFTKAGVYTVSVQEVIPGEAQRVPGISYSTEIITAVYRVVDDRNGQLTVALESFSGDTITNTYSVAPNSATITGTKELVGMELETGMFAFRLYETGEDYDITDLTPVATIGNTQDGAITFDRSNTAALVYSQPGVHYYVVTEDTTAAMENVLYDTRSYQVKVTVTDTGAGTLAVAVECVNAEQIVFRNVTHEEIAKKDVFTQLEPDISVDGQTVTPGQILVYTIRYKNHKDTASDVTITDRIPDCTTLVSVENGGVHEAGQITWSFTGVEPGGERTVTFRVRVEPQATSVENTAIVTENTTTVIDTNGTVTRVLQPALSIHKTQSVGDGAPTTEKLSVKTGNVVTYYITLKNDGEGPALGVRLTDEIPAGLTYVASSADHDGRVEAGTVKWDIGTLEAGAQVTVSFRVTVPSVKEDTLWTNVATVTCDNEAEPMDSNEVQIERKVPANHETGDAFSPVLFLGMMILSGFGLTAMLVVRKKEEETEAE